MDLDRQSIERRDFPISRRGYEPAAVDAHLRQLAHDVLELEETLDERAGETLGATAAGQVQSILEAAETTAADLERQAAEQAAATRSAAERDAARTREQAVARAQAHVQAVSQATAALLEKVQAMDEEVGTLVQSLRDGAGRLAADLRAVEVNMGELYDAAAGSDGGEGGRGGEGGDGGLDVGGLRVGGGSHIKGGLHDVGGSHDEGGLHDEGVLHDEGGLHDEQETAITGPPAAVVATNGSSEHAAPTSSQAEQAPSGASDDLDGARLIALNMALNGEPREQADRYLADNFDLPDRGKLLDEVYAAIEG